MKNKAYNTGTTPNVNNVENSRPAIMAIAIGSHISPPPRYSGINPSTVVAVVSNIGRKRFSAADMMASYGGKPSSSISSWMRSSRTMALLMTIPASEMMPSHESKERFTDQQSGGYPDQTQRNSHQDNDGLTDGVKLRDQ